jgi:hypothetical protein
MRYRIRVLLCIAALASVSAGAYAQENAKDSSQDYFGGLHKKGSQLISLSTGTNIPLFIVPADSSATQSVTLGVGAGFNLSYQYFIANRIAVGGTLAGAFNTTIAGRTLFTAPITGEASYWWGVAPLEFMVALHTGIDIMRLSGDGMITPFAKAGFGVFMQASNAWSVGGQAYWWFVPEFHTGTYTNLTRYGNFLEISISAIYHF